MDRKICIYALALFFLFTGVASGGQRITGDLTVPTGNVGIQDTAPARTLSVLGNANFGVNQADAGKVFIRQDATANNNAGLVLFNNAATGSARWWIDGDGIQRLDNGSAANFAIALNGAGTGNVGIGTVAPDDELEINAAAGGTLRLTYNDADGSATDYSTLGVAASGLTTLTTVDSDGAVGHVNINPDGNVGIKTATPDHELDIASGELSWDDNAWITYNSGEDSIDFIIN